MSVPVPKIDNRSYDDIVAETEALVQGFTGWKPVEEDGHLDAGGALIRIFSRLVEVAVTRLNQAPEKNFLVFLDLIGAQIQPPQPARAPLTFLLATGSSGDAFVPARTRVAATLAEGESQEILFETDRDLVVTKAQLKAVFVREPDRDRYGDYTPLATGEAEALVLTTGEKIERFPVFKGDRLIEHSLYLAHDELFALPAAKTIRFTFTSPNARQLANLPIEWGYWDGKAWSLLSVSTSTSQSRWSVEIANCPAPTPKVLNKLETRWLRAELRSPLLRQAQILTRLQSDQQVLDQTQPFYPFGEAQSPALFFYLCLDEAFERADGQVQLQFLLSQSGQVTSTALRLSWRYLEGNDWRLLGESGPDQPLSPESGFAFTDETQGFTQDGLISFRCPPNWQAETLFKHTGRWLQVGLSAGAYAQPPQISAIQVWPSIEVLPSINQITVSILLEQTDLPPQFGFTNSIPLDLGKDFYPFGAKPRLNDALYLALDHPAASAETGAATVTVNVELSELSPISVNPSDDLVVAWEALTANEWEELRQSPPKPDTQDTVSSPLSFTASGSFELSLPENMAFSTVNGEESYWIRARIVRGDYGVETAPGQVATFTTLTAEAAANTHVLTVSSVRGFMPGDQIWIELGGNRQESARVIDVDFERDDSGNFTRQQLTIESTDPGSSNGGLVHTHPVDAGVYLRSDNLIAPPSLKALRLRYVYDTAADPAALTTCQSCNDFSYKNHTLAAAQNSGSSFHPFTPTPTPTPTLYLGFDQPFANRPTTLYAQVDPPAYDQAAGVQNRTTARLNWEYRGSSGWIRLEVQDQTRAFAERGLLTFMGPQNFVEASEFGRTLYWLRLIWAGGDFQISPYLRCLRTNTTWASQAITLQQEILGSSNSNPNQVFQTTKAPVLQGQQLEVQERETLVAQEAETPDQGQFVWIIWRPQSDFYGSKPQDRHYVLDALTGEVRFGDGKSGKIPPRGRNNIRITYRAGGGQRGDRAAKTLNQLKSAIPYVEGVINYEAATGGANAETLDRIKEEGPKVLRHQGRAVTAQDFEDLAYRASSDVARAKAIPAQSDDGAGRMGLVLVPRSREAQPIPSLELLNQVEDYIRDRCAPTLDFWTAGPDWVKVTVKTEIAPVSWQAALSLDAKIIESLQHFLHPLTGGLDHQGWAFSREPHKSDLYALLESIEGVGHVQSLKVEKEGPQDGARPRHFLVFSGDHAITLVSPEAEEV